MTKRSDSHYSQPIRVIGARQHNLKNISVEIPRHSLTVITGPSGSGKSSLAFDTLFAEGQRRYVESLSAYARQFLDQLQKPKVDRIEGLAPAIAIEQRSAGGSPRSIVATTTEIYDYLRLLYAHVGTPHCPQCHGEVERQTVQQICDRIIQMPVRRRMIILAPYVRGRKGEHQDVLERIAKEGFVRVRVDGEIHSVEDTITLEKNIKHTIEAVVDRLYTGEQDRIRLTDSIERALHCGQGLLILLMENAEGGWDEELISEHAACLRCGISIGELLPRNFSFNSPYGACPMCHGLGTLEIPDLEKVIIPNRTADKACTLLNSFPSHIRRFYRKLILAVVRHYGYDEDTPYAQLSREVRDAIRYGTKDERIPVRMRWGGRIITRNEPFEGLNEIIMRRYREKKAGRFYEATQAILHESVCPQCKGGRLRPESLAVTVGGKNIHEFIELPVSHALEFINNLKFSGEAEKIAHDLLREIRTRLGFLQNLGLDYLTLSRTSKTLSGGEAQRIRLATQLGSGLTGVMYVLDEPTIGLHPRDNHRLIETLQDLRNKENTVIVVEHDLDTIKAADYVIDLGPGAGRHGGQIVAQGTCDEIAANPKSLTGAYLLGKCKIPVPRKRQKVPGKFSFLVQNANLNNLKNIDVTIPGNTITCITG
ncbi:MAG: excinuclease ABC subunit A, partial [Lentisphaerae bacterium]